VEQTLKTLHWSASIVKKKLHCSTGVVKKNCIALLVSLKETALLHWSLFKKLHCSDGPS